MTVAQAHLCCCRSLTVGIEFDQAVFDSIIKTVKQVSRPACLLSTPSRFSAFHSLACTDAVDIACVVLWWWGTLQAHVLHLTPCSGADGCAGDAATTQGQGHPAAASAAAAGLGGAVSSR